MTRPLAILLLLGFPIMVHADDATRQKERTFAEDVAFLAECTKTIVLGKDARGPRVAVVPAYQGRVMTSTATGNDGQSYGWLNYEHIASGRVVPHINVYGGEERFWLGPEGGRFAIFFPPGAEFKLEDWQTPSAIDTATYEVVERADRLVRFRYDATLRNMSSAEFDVAIDRTVRLLEETDVESMLQIKMGNAQAVGYETDNRLTNRGKDWRPETGLLSIWILGMYKHGPETTVVIPYRKGADAEFGPAVNANYFGAVPDSRLKVTDAAIFFSGDGQYRSKIGLNPRRATPLCGSYDAERNVLTCVQYNQPKESGASYVNSQWKLQDEPYGGDVINSYNDGPPKPGKPPLGPFYELETSSPALALKSGETGRHIQRTFHFEGSRSDLDRIARKLFGTTLDGIESAVR